MTAAIAVALVFPVSDSEDFSSFSVCLPHYNEARRSMVGSGAYLCSLCGKTCVSGSLERVAGVAGSVCRMCRPGALVLGSRLELLARERDDAASLATRLKADLAAAQSDIARLSGRLVSHNGEIARQSSKLSEARSHLRLGVCMAHAFFAWRGSDECHIAQ